MHIWYTYVSHTYIHIYIYLYICDRISCIYIISVTYLTSRGARPWDRWHVAAWWAQVTRWVTQGHPGHWINLRVVLRYSQGGRGSIQRGLVPGGEAMEAAEARGAWQLRCDGMVDEEAEILVAGYFERLHQFQWKWYGIRTNSGGIIIWFSVIIVNNSSRGSYCNNWG